MSQFITEGTRTFTAGAAIAKHLRVKLTAGKLAAAGSTDHELGTLDEAALADLDIRSVRLRTAQGTVRMVAVDAITAGNPVYAAASGKISASGTVLIGIALEASANDGDVIEVLRRQEASDSAAAGGTTAAAFEIDSDSTKPKIGLASQTGSGATGDYTTTLKPETTLSGDNAIIVPEADGDTLVAVALAQTLTNKTLTSPTIRQTTGTVAVGGTAIGNANAVTEGYNRVTAADDTAAVILPASVAGKTVTIKNAVANKILIVFPPVSSQINANGANNAYNQAAGSVRTYHCFNTTLWETAPETIA